MSEVLESRYILEYTYTRSVGPVIGRFLAGLREGRICGVRTRSGRVLVPPTEYDPLTGDACDELVPVADSGIVKSWSWNGQPHALQPLARPFAWALIQLDGADTAMLHAVDAGEPGKMKTGMRVRARWAEQRKGNIHDIACFEPGAARDDDRAPLGPFEPVKVAPSPVRLEYTVTAGRTYSRYLHQLAQGRITGGRCPECKKVYVPPRGSCPTCGVPTGDGLEVSDQGTVTTFCIVNIPFGNMPFDPPYVVAAVLLDGADLPILHLVRGVDAHALRMGQRVRAVWLPAAERTASVESIRWFEPNGEPDADYASFEVHL